MIRVAVVWSLCVALALGTPTLVCAAEMVVNGDFSYSGSSQSLSSGLGSFQRMPNLNGWSIGQYGNGNASYLSIYEGHDYTPVPIWNNGKTPTGSGGNYTGGWDPGYTGNILSIDGDYTYQTNVRQTVTGLTIGESYTLSFDYAFGQQQGSPGVNTGIRGIVNWGGSFGGSWTNGHFSGGTFYRTDPGEVTAALAFDGWHTFTTTLVATATSELLGFSATGAGDPPVMLLANVSLQSQDPPPPTPDTVPEPSGFALGAIALGCCAAYRARRKSIRTATEV